MAIGKKTIRSFKLRTQFSIDKSGKGKLRLVSTRKLMADGKQVQAGQAVDKAHPLSVGLANPKRKLKGKKLRAK